MFTLEEFKQNVAQDLGYNTWNHFLKSGDPTYVILQQLQLANDRYRDYYAEEMCVRQREMCADRACFSIETRECNIISSKQIASIDEQSNNHYFINKKHILETELATKLV